MIAAVDPVGAGVKSSPDDLLKTVSASRLNTWLACRLRYYFRYVARITKPKTAPLYVGTTVHSVLKQWNLARWCREVVTVEQLKPQFDQLWIDDQKKDPIRWEQGDEPGERAMAWSLLDLSFKGTPIPADERPEGG